MLRILRTSIILFIATSMLAACSSSKQEKYIPKNAEVVAGLNMSALGKKIAWNMITGSDLFKQMRKKSGSNGEGAGIMENIDKAGIDVMNTFYVYLKNDQRYDAHIHITGLVPLSSSSDWEAFVKKNFPKANIKADGDINMAALNADMYVGWNKSILIIMNKMEAGGEAEMEAEMKTAFNVDESNSILKDDKFNKLKSEDHDVLVWLNYGKIMDDYVTENAAVASNASVMASMWKDSYFTGGIDFNKGAIDGRLDFYGSKQAVEFYKKYCSDNVDAKMLDIVPTNRLAMVAAVHLNPELFSASLESAGYTKIVDAALSAQGLSLQTVLSSITGDISFSINELNLSAQKKTMDLGDRSVTYNDTKRDLAMNLLLKIKDKNGFGKIIDLVKTTGYFMPYSNGYMMPFPTGDTVFLLYNDQYAIVSNKSASVNAILSGNAGGKMTEEAKKIVYGHSASMYLDVQEIFKGVDAATMFSPAELQAYNETQKLLKNIYMHTDLPKDDKVTTKYAVNFMNKEENSILILLDYGMKISEAIDKANSESAKQPDPANLNL